MQFALDYATLSPRNFQTSHALLQISVTALGSPTIRSWFDPSVHKLVRLTSDTTGAYLRITKLGATPKDSWKNYAGLNPRVEICTPTLCRKGYQSKWQYTIRIPKCPEGHCIIFQLMDKEDDGTTPLPTFQLIVRKGKMCARYAEITTEGKRGLLVYQDLFSMDTYWDQWMTFDIEGLLNYVRGRMNVKLNGKLIWAKERYPTASRTPKAVKMAYGVYGYPGPDFTLHVRKISYSS